MMSGREAMIALLFGKRIYNPVLYSMEYLELDGENKILHREQETDRLLDSDVSVSVVLNQEWAVYCG